MGEGNENPLVANKMLRLPTLSLYVRSEFRLNLATTHSPCRSPLLLEDLQGGISKHGCPHQVLLSTTRGHSALLLSSLSCLYNNK
jgi:hypothetical protein